MNEPTSLRALIMDSLKEKGFDGLCNPIFECGCGLDDFTPCLDLNSYDCLPAYKHSDGLFYANKEGDE